MKSTKAHADPTRPADEAIAPNVVLAGVRKCGTTSVYEWLSDHPAVCCSSKKGTEFLMDPDSRYCIAGSNYHDCGLEGYREFYRHYRGQSVVLDATTRYLDQTTARSVLASLRPRPHVLFVLREPAERVASSFRYLKNNRDKLAPGLTFSQFVQCLLENRIEELLPVHDSPAATGRQRQLEEFQHDIAHGQYVDYLIAWRNSLGADRVHVYLFEQMKRDPLRFMQSLAADIGIDPHFYDQYEFVVSNRSFHLRSPWLHRVVRGLKRFVPKTQLTRSAYRAYLRLQGSSRADQKTEDETAMQKLRDYYRPYNERLAQEFSIELKSWGG